MSRRTLVALAALMVVLVAGGLVAAVLSTSGGDDEFTLYSARSHYGEEQPFKTFAEREDIALTIFGGSAGELYERLRNEGSDSEADALITVDAANLWRAEQAGFLEPVRSPVLERNVPAALRDPGGRWFGLTVRARTLMRSTERVGARELETYEDLGDPRYKGRTCLRSGTSEYNISFVADRIAKDGEGATRELLERWMANDPEILGSDVDVLKAIDSGRCDVGLTNSYYLGRELAEDEDFAVAPVWADQDGRGTHVNLSGIAIVKASDKQAEARALAEFLTSREQQQVFARNNHEFGVDESVESTPEITRFGSFKRDPIDVAGAGEHLDDAVRMMNSINWD